MIFNRSTVGKFKLSLQAKFKNPARVFKSSSTMPSHVTKLTGTYRDCWVNPGCYISRFFIA